MNTDINTSSLALSSSVSICAPAVANLLPPQANVTVRVATIEDVPFIDGLQKLHRKQVGFLMMKAIEGKIAKGEILVAEDGEERLGYCIGTDRYFKHDDVGIIYQLNVVPGNQRKFVGATLLKAMFDRAAYGCRLFCCWCAQDIAANRFWEAMGFVPIAFRAGSEKKRRVHIFWEKRIREGDTTTQWWYPSETSGGSMGENRLALPIPPGKHWADEMPVVLPEEPREVKAIDGPRATAISNPKSEIRKVPKLLTTAVIGMRFANVEPVQGEAAAPAVAPSVPRKRAPKRKNDPKLIAAAREIKDRWLEHVNAGGAQLVSEGKYDLTRALSALSAVEGPERIEVTPLLLPAA